MYLSIIVIFVYLETECNVFSSEENRMSVDAQ